MRGSCLHSLWQLESDKGAPPDGLVDRVADQERHFGGEVQAVYNVNRQEDGTHNPEILPVEADCHHERNEQNMQNLPELVRELQKVCTVPKDTRSRRKGASKHGDDIHREGAPQTKEV